LRFFASSIGGSVDGTVAERPDGAAALVDAAELPSTTTAPTLLSTALRPTRTVHRPAIVFTPSPRCAANNERLTIVFYLFFLNDVLCCYLRVSVRVLLLFLSAHVYASVSVQSIGRVSPRLE
jgi:hypothetical protein